MGPQGRRKTEHPRHRERRDRRRETPELGIVVGQRRRQADRSDATRRLLLEATVESLATVGYARTTTTEVCRRAGVSQGALVHHFGSKGDLVVSALRHVLDRRLTDFTASFDRIARRGPVTLPDAIDLVWAAFRGPTYRAWVELVVAGSSEPALRAAVGEVTGAFGLAAGDTFRRLFPAPEEPSPFYEVATKFLFPLLEGLALEEMAGHELAEVHHKEVLEAVKALALLLIRTEHKAMRKGGPDANDDD